MQPGCSVRFSAQKERESFPGKPPVWPEDLERNSSKLQPGDCRPHVQNNRLHQEAFEQLQSNYEILLEENKQLKIQVEAYQNQINQIEEDKKKEFLNKYSSLLDEEEYNKYNNKIQEYSLEDLKKDISLELLEKNEDTLFSKRETKETVSKLPSQNLSGAARIMQEYFDK